MVLKSILGFWAFYFAVGTARSLVLGQAHQALLLAPRATVTVVSVGATLAVWAGLRLGAARRLSRAVTLAMALCWPAAAAYGASDFYAYDRWLPRLLRAGPRVPSSPPTAAVTVDARPAEARPAGPQIIAIALNGYFFFVGWCALYLALDYAGRVGALERRATALGVAAQAAELRALRHQVNPHFLFNTLNSLSSLVLARDTDAAEQMIINLAEFFRASLSEDLVQDVALADEVALQRLYLEIERVRFGDRLTLEIDLPQALAAARLPGLILQPLVENAVKHGVARTRRPVTIRIAARDEQDTLVVEIDDDGPGLPRAGDAGKGLGLVNVRRRLEARFGPAARVAWRPRGKDGASGFCVTVTLPMVRDAG